MVLGIDDNLNFANIYQMEDIYVNYLEKNGLRFLINDGETIIINSDNRKIAEFPFLSKPVVIGDKLYGLDGKSLLEINLKDLLPSTTVL